MVRWQFLASPLLIALLAGCSSAPGSEEISTPSTEEARTSVQGTPEGFVDGPLDQTFTGEIKGVGLVLSDGSNHFLGVSTFPHEFEVPPGSDLVVTLTWDFTAPAVVDLILATPGREVIILEALPDSQLGREIQYSAKDVEAGQWSVRVRSQGPALIDYSVQTVASPAASP